jgi:5-methylcytosine-specific restriction endonuclease McrA
MGKKRRKTGWPKKIVKRLVWERDEGRCQICNKKVDPWDWQLARDRAGVKGGKYTVDNCFVAHSSCNESMGTNTLKQVRKKIGISTRRLASRKIRKAKSPEEVKDIFKIVFGTPKSGKSLPDTDEIFDIVGIKLPKKKKSEWDLL